jgi:hypothetical protein
MSTRLRIFVWIIIGVLVGIWLAAIWFVTIHPGHLSKGLGTFILGVEALALCLALIISFRGNSDSEKSGMS